MAAARKAPPDPLTVAEILALKTELEDQFRTDDTAIRDMRMVREQKDPVAVGIKRYTTLEVRDPTITNEVFDSVAALSENPAAVTCIYKPGGSDSAEQNATQRNAFYTELIEDMCTRIEGQNTRIRGIDMSLGDGGTWTKVLYAKDLWEEAGALRRRKPGEAADAYTADLDQAKKDAGQPFVAIAVDPLSFYPVRSGTKLILGMEVQKRPLTQTLLQYDLKVDDEGNITKRGPDSSGGTSIPPNAVGQPQNRWDATKKPTTVDLIEVWDEFYCYVVIIGAGMNGYAVDPWLHGYGRPPYFPAMGAMMGHWSNVKVGWGIAQAKRPLVQYSSFLKTIMGDVAARDTYTPTIHVLGEQSAQAVQASAMIKDGKPDWTEDMKVELREIVRAFPGDEWLAWPTKDIAPALKEAIGQNTQDLQNMMPPKLTSSSGGGMEGAGYAMSQVREEAHQKYHPYVMNLEQMWADIIGFIDWLIVHKVKDTVWLYAAPKADPEQPGGKVGGGWIGVGPDDITKFPVKVTVQIDPDRATAKLVEGQYWAQQYAAEMTDLDTAIRAQGRDPLLVRQGRTKDRIRKSDWYMAWEDEQVTDAMGMGNLLAKSKLAQMVAQTGGLPGQSQSAPPSPPGPQAGPMQTAATGLAASPGAQQPDMARGMPPGGTDVPTPTLGAAAGASTGAMQ